jgi:hypothetical protein
LNSNGFIAFAKETKKHQEIKRHMSGIPLSAAKGEDPTQLILSSQSTNIIQNPP